MKIDVGIGINGLRGAKPNGNPSAFEVALYNPDGVDEQELRFSWTASSEFETEIEWRIVGGEWALLATIAPNTGVYVYDIVTDPSNVLEYGLDYELEFRARWKYDTTVLNIPTSLASELITGGVRLTWDDNNTEADSIQIYADINNAGYALLDTVNDGVETYDHIVTGGVTVRYKIRAKEGTLPVYSDYTAEITQAIPLVDQDGNVYTTIVIGTQTWMVENFKSTKYNDGSQIPIGANAAAKLADTSGMMSYPDDNINNKDAYGCLYNWYAVNNVKGFCPPGFRVATKADYVTLATTLGGDTIAGKKMKEIGTTYWNNAGGDNSSGFSSRGAGYVSGTTGNNGNFKFFNVLMCNSESTIYNFWIQLYTTYDYWLNGVNQLYPKCMQGTVRMIKI